MSASIARRDEFMSIPFYQKKKQARAQMGYRMLTP